MRYIIKKFVDAESLKEDIKALDICQKDMANSLGVTESKLCRWISGATVIPEEYFEPIETYLMVRKEQRIAALKEIIALLEE